MLKSLFWWLFKILEPWYRPAFAVREELTTQQSILQNQIDEMNDSLYRLVFQRLFAFMTTYDLNYYAVKLTSFDKTITNFKDNNSLAFIL